MESFDITSNRIFTNTATEEKFENDDNLNNIFLSHNNLNLCDEEDMEELFDSEEEILPCSEEQSEPFEREKVVLNICNPPNSFREISIVFSRGNTERILKERGVAYNDVSSMLAYHGKYRPSIKDEEVERIVNEYIKEISTLSDNTLSYYDTDVVTSFIHMYKVGSVNSILSYFTKKVKARSKSNTSPVSVQNILFNFNVDKFRELHFGITSDYMNFDSLEDRELFILDYVRMYWELYILLVFYSICEVRAEDEVSFFRNFHKVAPLAMFSGMKMFVQLELTRSYGELYEELRGFVPINPKYMFVKDIKDRQQLHFVIKNADFLTDAYKHEYKGAVHISKHIGNIKNDTHVDIDFCIMKGSQNNTVLFEVTFSGQYPLGRIYSAETDPEIVINMTNMYYYGLPVYNPVVYLFRQILEYSKDNKKRSYYTELQNYLKQFKGKRTRNLIQRFLPVILLLLYKKPTKEEFESFMNKYFKTTDKVQRRDFRNLYNELQSTMVQNKLRLVDELRKELKQIVW